MSDQAEFRPERTQEMFLPAMFPAVPPQSGGAEVVELAAYRGTTKFERRPIVEPEPPCAPR